MGQQLYGLFAPGSAQTYAGRHTHLRHPAWTPGSEATAGATQDYPRSRIARGARGPPKCNRSPPTVLLQASLVMQRSGDCRPVSIGCQRA
jgi:hypothetical protein